MPWPSASSEKLARGEGKLAGDGEEVVLGAEDGAGEEIWLTTDVCYQRGAGETGGGEVEG